MAALEQEANTANDTSSAVQKGTVEFHNRMGHLSYDAVERWASDPSSGIGGPTELSSSPVGSPAPTGSRRFPATSQRHGSTEPCAGCALGNSPADGGCSRT
ncbi:hypothetical protein PC123_g15008 [Phytophthora cactorum]|nr:hypothetical protein PC120_g14857 [Phytophthora cactorum]KAG4049722.1 hypothetical protein PC123_g15008 [Phytophthora cactorum]